MTGPLGDRRQSKPCGCDTRKEVKQQITATDRPMLVRRSAKTEMHSSLNQVEDGRRPICVLRAFEDPVTVGRHFADGGGNITMTSYVGDFVEEKY